MPISCPLVFEPVSDLAFDQIDDAVIRCAYASQNELGRLCDERVYENDLADRLRSLGFTVSTQVPVIVTHGTFSKTYRLDLVVNGVVYELKVTTSVTAEHEAQALHYAVLVGTNRAKLINFGQPKVLGLLKRTQVTRRSACNLQVNDRFWKPQSSACSTLAARMESFMKDVGGFLHRSLYEEAMIHACGGESTCVKRLVLSRRDIELGTHRFTCHDNNMAFYITTHRFGGPRHESQIRRLLPLSGLRTIQWFNIKGNVLEKTTLLP